MNKKEAWQRIPSLVRRYGPNGARAVCDVVHNLHDEALLGLIIQADACALYNKPQEAARLYVRASQAVGKDMCLRQTSALLESAIQCHPSQVKIRMKLIEALHVGGLFWRAGEHLGVLVDYDCSNIVLSHWVEFLARLSIEPCMQTGLLKCCVWIRQYFTRTIEQQQICKVVSTLRKSAQDSWSVCWNEYVKKQVCDKQIDTEFLLYLT